MKLGIFSVVDHYPKLVDRSVGQFYSELLGQCALADELGLDSFWIAEHHFHEYGAIPRPAIWMAAAAQRTKKIKLGAAVVVLPFDNPLRSAEDFAMVDVLSGGRLKLGVGSGYLKHEFAGFNIEGSEKRERFDEALQIFLEAWKGDSFSFSGKYNTVSDVSLNIVPVQTPTPPVYVAVLSNEAAVHVGKRGMPVMMIPYATTEAIDELAAVARSYHAAYREATEAAADYHQEKSSPPVSTAKTSNQAQCGSLAFGLHTYCAPTTAQARAEAREWLDRYVQTRLYARQRSFDELIERDLIAVGDPDEVLRVARRYGDAGLNEFLAITNFGGAPDHKVRESIKLMAEHVMPALATVRT